ncbi:transglutaminase superfamily protein [Bibersteinia trehalosi]|uniref:transglutaminase domain-containing protein n=1 Tax=Bibersteinia trehalosi TaxID=47735 RepID=UPI0010444207|nr:transglutaminase domain-containing protein [Bibersteinia trehalosi]TCT15259.1 transglutaminase superfamily protein [Bibersteinia trehalosi]
MTMHLKISHAEFEETIAVTPNSSLKLKLQPNTSYQLVDENSKVLEISASTTNGQDIVLFEKTRNVPIVYLENPEGFAWGEAENSLTIPTAEILVEQGENRISTGTLLYTTGGLLLLGGIVAAASSSGGKSGGNNNGSTHTDKTTVEPVRLETKKAEQSRLEAEKAEQVHFEAEKREQARLEAEKAEQVRLEAEKAEQVRLEAEKREQARLEAEKAEQVRLEVEKAEQVRLEAEKREQARLAAEKAEQVRFEAEKREQARLEAEKAEQVRLEAEKAEQVRLEAEKREQARLAAEKAEQARLEAEKADQVRLEAEKREQARLEAEKAEQVRLEAEKAEQERLDVEKETIRLEIERAEEEKLTPKEQFIRRIFQAALKGEERIDVSDLNISETKIVAGQDYLYATDAEYKNWYDSFKIKYPFLFHLNHTGEYSWQYKAENPNEVKSYNIGYSIPTQKIGEYYNLMEKSLESYYNDLREGMGQADIAYAMYNRLIKEVFYKEEGHPFHSVGALVHQKAVCEGYSSAYRLLMDLLGIETQMVVSAVLPNSSMAHVWNRIKIDGQWYNVDATWDDNPRLPFALGAYFLTSDNKFYFNEKHPQPLSFYQIPPADSSRFDFSDTAFFRNNLNQTDAVFHNGYWHFINKSSKEIIRAKIGETAETLHTISAKLHKSELRLELGKDKIYFVDFDQAEGRYAIYSIDYQGKNLQKEKNIGVDEVSSIALKSESDIPEATLGGDIALRKALALAKFKDAYYPNDDYFNPQDSQHIALKQAINEAEGILNEAPLNASQIENLTGRLNTLRISKAVTELDTTELHEPDNELAEITLNNLTNDDNLINFEESKQIKPNSLSNSKHASFMSTNPDELDIGRYVIDEEYDLRGANDDLMSSLANNMDVGSNSADTFVFDAPLSPDNIEQLPEFSLSEDKIQLVTSIFNSVTAQNVHEQIQYNAEKGTLSYNGEVFAVLPTGLDETQIQYIVA